MTLLFSPLIFALYIASFSTAATLRGQVLPNNLLRDYWRAGPSGRVIAYPANLTPSTDGGEIVDRHGARHYEAFIKRDGSWSLELPDPASRQEDWELTQQVTREDGSVETIRLPPKSDLYLLRYRLRGLQFRQFRVDVRPAKREGQAPLIAVRVHNPTFPLLSASYLSNVEPLPLVEGPTKMPTFFHSVQDFNAVNYLWMTLKSPMILMALGAWVLTSLLPKLTASLEPKELTQTQQAQAQIMGHLRTGDSKVAAAATTAGSDSQGASKGATGVQIRAGSGQANKRR